MAASSGASIQKVTSRSGTVTAAPVPSHCES